MVVGAHVHRQRLGDGAQAARLRRTVDPGLERPGAAFLFDMADEEGELAERVLDHVGPRHVAFRQIRAAGPAQAGEHRRGQVLDRQAAVGVVADEVLRLLLVLGLLGRRDRQHGAEHAVGAVGGEALEAGLPGAHVEALEVLVGVVGRHVDRFRDRGVDVGRDGGDDVLVRLGRDFERRDEVIGQLLDVAAEVLVEAPGVVLDGVFLERAVGHALLAAVGPREGRLDAVRGVVGEGQRDGAGRRDRQQVRVAQAVLADFGLDFGRQARGEVAAREVELGVEQREGAALLGQFDRGEVGGVAHVFGDARGHRRGFRTVVAQAQHAQRVAQAGEAEADAALVGGFLALAVERPGGHVEHVVEHARRHLDHFAEGGEIELGLVGEGVADEQGQVDRTEAAAAVRRQRLFGARVGGFDQLAVVEVVVLVHAVEEEDPRLGMIVGGLHHLIPQVARAHLAVDPQAVVALVGAGLLHVGVRLGAVRQLDVAVGLDGFHEGIGDADRDVEIGQVAVVLGVDEDLDVRMVAAQHAHLGAAPGAGRFDGLARAVEDAHVGDGARGARLRALDQRAHRTDRREVVADAAAAAHGLGGLRERGVDAGLAVDDFDDRIADRLHEAVDQRRREVGAGGGVDTAGRNEAVFLRPEEFRFPVRALLFFLVGGERVRDAAAHVMHGGFLALGVLFDQHLGRDFLLGQRRDLGGVGDRRQGQLLCNLAHVLSLCFGVGIAARDRSRRCKRTSRFVAMNKVIGGGLVALNKRKTTTCSGIGQELD